jgi:hypothetical protein
MVLDKIHIPKGVTVLEMSDLRKRYIQAVQEGEDIYVRGWGACELARLDPFSMDSVAKVTGLLEDTNEWMRLNAVTALEMFGKRAASSVPALKRAAETSNENLKARAEAAIVAIERANDSAAAEERRRQILQEISAFRKTLGQGSGP